MGLENLQKIQSAAKALQPASNSLESDSAAKKRQTAIGGFQFHPEISLRISWLELQMTIVLLVSCGIFMTVAIFLLYVCCYGGRAAAADQSKPDLMKMPSGTKTHKRVGKTNFELEF